LNSGGKCIVTCARAPPQIGGTPSVMYELLRHFPKGSVVLITKVQDKDISTDDRVLGVETYTVGGLGSSVYHMFFQLLLLPITTLSILRRVRAVGDARTILAVFPTLDFLIASLFVAKMRRLPVYAYLHDCIVETATNPLEVLPARFAERQTFKQSVKVYSMSDPMRSFYELKGLKTETLPHGVDVSLLRKPEDRRSGEGTRVGFSGIVYETNIGAISDLVEAKKRSGGLVEIRASCPRQSLLLLTRRGLAQGMDSISTLATREEVLDLLSGCDVLFIPMSFESKLKSDLLTIFPTKITDYWLAQRPILVYGPREYAFVNKAEMDGYARVVSEGGPDGILKALREMAASEPLRRSLVEASLEMVKRHDSAAVSRRLMADLGIGGETK